MDKIFDFISEERLFHFLADPTSAAGIEIITPHLTDSKAPLGEGSMGTTAMSKSATTATSATAAATKPVAATATTSTSVPASTASSDDPFLKNLFAANKGEKGNDLMFQSLIKSEEKNVEKKKSILGELPKIDTSLFIDREYHLKRQLSGVKIALACFVTLGFFLFLYFYAQLDPNFNLFGSDNVGKRLSTTNDQLRSMQTQVNFYRYRIAKKDLDQFFYQANEYLQKYDAWKSTPADNPQKSELLSDLDTAKTDLTKPFDDAREKLSKSIIVPLYHEVDPVANRETLDPAAAAEEEKKLATQEFQDSLKQYIDTQKTGANPDEVRDLNEMKMIVGNNALLALTSTDLSKMSHADLRAFILQMSNHYNQRLAFIFHIKDHRIPWYSIITEIYDKTTSIDKGRFKTKLYKDVGGIQYTGFDFNGDTGRITISGNVKDFDGVNFTIVADLIDILEGSSKFKDVEMRTFSKSFTSDKDGFEGNFKIDLSLQKEDDRDSRDTAVNLGSLSNVFSAPKAPDVTPDVPDVPATPATPEPATEPAPAVTPSPEPAAPTDTSTPAPAPTEPSTTP